MLPTPALNPTVGPLLFVKLQNLPEEWRTIDPQTWKRKISDHVKNFWQAYEDQSPIYVGRTVTTPIQQDWEATSGTTTGTLTITYSQDVSYLLREGVEPYPGFQESDIYTLPFQQDPRSYTTSLTGLFNNSATPNPGIFIFLESSGLAENPGQRSSSETTTIAVTVSMVSLVLICATAYIIYLTKYKHPSEELDADRDSPIVGAVIGVNPNENIIISESYDEEFNDVIYPNGKAKLLADGQQDGSGDELKKPPRSSSDEGGLTGSDDEPPVRDLMASPEDAAFPTLSSANMSPGDFRDTYYADSPMLSVRASSAGSEQSDLPDGMVAVSPLGGTPPRRNVSSGSDEERDENADEDEEPSVPFMGFQMEIQDLE